MKQETCDICIKEIIVTEANPCEKQICISDDNSNVCFCYEDRQKILDYLTAKIFE